jgi:lipopolysaccharide transport system ATP-binding protein
MSEIAIRVEKLGKRYEIGELVTMRDLPRLLGHVLTLPVRSLMRRSGRSTSSGLRRQEMWAIKDINFQVKKGEIVGIIGRNGAGKSTLLKVLSRVTAPSEGRADIYGRVGSLLEVGTGFHPELTGRENVYLSGAILGMTTAEIKAHFQEILEFAGVGEYIDTPVKRYSSGMRVRLGFAVAAHLTPEILFIDEVLAVGDFEFQSKCMQKMGDIAQVGRTILFVSHNMGSIQSLCTRAMVLRKGQVVFDGPVDEAVHEYTEYLNQSAGIHVENPERKGTGGVRLVSGRVIDHAGRDSGSVVAGLPAVIELKYEQHANVRTFCVELRLFTQSGVPVTTLCTEYADISVDGRAGSISCTIPKLPLLPGSYLIAVLLRNEWDVLDFIPNAILFRVSGSVFFRAGQTPREKYAVCMMEHTWKQP